MAPSEIFANAPRSQRIASGVIGLAIVAAIGYFILSPKAVERDALRHRSEVLAADALKARDEEADLRPFRAQADTLRRRLEASRSRLPAEREIPALYRQLSDLALQSGLAVPLFASKPAQDADSLAEVLISMTAEGTYDQLAGFLSRMGKIVRIVSLGDFRLGGVERPTGTLRAELTLATYLLRADNSLAAGAVRSSKPNPPALPIAPAPPVTPPGAPGDTGRRPASARAGAQK